MPKDLSLSAINEPVPPRPITPQFLLYSSIGLSFGLRFWFKNISSISDSSGLPVYPSECEKRKGYKFSLEYLWSINVFGNLYFLTLNLDLSSVERFFFKTNSLFSLASLEKFSFA